MIDSAAKWQDLWANALGQREPPTAVDFGKRLAVAVFLGSVPTGGYGVDFLAPQSAGGTTILSYRIRRPGQGSFVIQAFTQPYAVKLFDKPAGAVELREAR